MIVLLLGIPLISCLIALLLLIWFNTEAVPEYARLFGLRKLFRTEDFQLEKVAGDGILLSYPQFLRKDTNSSLIRMITCPICLSVWFTILFELMLAVGMLVAGKTYLLLFWGLYLLFIVSGPTICILSLIIYGVVVSLLKLR